MAKATTEKKTMKGFKQLPKTDKEIVKAFEADMQASQEQAQLKAQRKEFGKYLAEKTKASDFKFFHDMLKKLDDEVILTENMEAAIRKCMKQDEARNKPVDESKLPKVSLKMKPWWMKQNNLDSRVITGVVLRESAKAYLVKGHADMLENMCWCARCGRELTEPASQVTGFGEVCAGHLGIPYDAQGVLQMNKKQRAAIRKQFVEKLQAQQFELWVPKSQVAEVLEGTL